MKLNKYVVNFRAVITKDHIDFYQNNYLKLNHKLNQIKMLRLKLNDTIYQEMNADQFLIKVNGISVDLRDIKYLMQINVLDTNNRSVIIMSRNARTDIYNSILSICYFLQKKKSENAKRQIMLPTNPVETNYNGGYYKIKGARISEKGISINNGLKDRFLGFNEISELSPWAPRNQQNCIDVQTFKDFANLVMMEKKGQIFDPKYYSKFKPEEGIILVTENKSKIIEIIMQSSIVSNGVIYSFKDFFQVNELKVISSTNEDTRFEFPYKTHTPNKPQKNQLKPNTKDFVPSNYPNLLIVSYKDLGYLKKGVRQNSLFSESGNFFIICYQFMQYFALAAFITHSQIEHLLCS